MSEKTRVGIARLLVTLIAPLVVVLLQRIPCPGLDAVEVESIGSLTMFSVGAIGFMPFISAAALVELTALVVYAWRPLREDEEGRATLARRTRVLAVLLAFFQAYGVVNLLASASQSSGLVRSPLVALGSIVAAFCVLLATAELVSRRGLINGPVALLLVQLAMLGLDPHATGIIDPDATSPVHRALLHGTVAIVILIVTIALPLASRGGERGLRYSTIPAPASGVVAAAMVLNLSAFPATLASLGVPVGKLDEQPLSLKLILGIILAALFTRVFHRLGGLSEAWGAPQKSFDGVLLGAIATSVAFTAALLVIPELVGEPRVAVGASSIALLGGACVDAWHRLHLDPAMRPLRSFIRPYQAEAARASLASHGLRVALADLHQRTLLQFFGPFVPIGLHVHRDDRERAKELLGAKSELPAHSQPWIAPVVGCAAAMLATFALDQGLHAVYAEPPLRQGPPIKLEMVLLDDELDWLAPHVDRIELPGRVDFLIENAPIGPGRTAPRYYAHVPKDEVPPAVHQALESLLPPGHRLAWERTFERDEEREGVHHPNGWRSYLLMSTVALDNRHIASARAEAEQSDFGTSWFVMIHFTDEGIKLFEEVTAKNVKRRFAILTDGVVTSAPVINEPIRGGRARVTMGVGTPEEQMREARRLEQGLRAAMGR